MTALSIVQSACRRLGLDVPQALFSSTDPVIVQMLGVMNESLIEIANEHQWSFLVDTDTFTADITNTVQGNGLGVYEYYINDTMYNRTAKKQLIGPMSPQEWSSMLGYSDSFIDQCFRFTASKSVEIYPQPSSADTIAYSFIAMDTLVSPSDSSGGTDDDYSLPAFLTPDEMAEFNKSDATPDYQSTLINEEVITLGLVWKWKQKKGFDYAEDFASYTRALELAISRDGGKKKLNMTKGTFSLRKVPNVPDNGFG